jgi:WD repeat-containing protein 81
LPRGRPVSNTKNQAELIFSQLLHYVAETNYRNLWKETYKKYYSMYLANFSFLKFYYLNLHNLFLFELMLSHQICIDPWNFIEQKEQSNITANTNDVVIMHEVLNRMYGCTLIQVQHGIVLSVSNGISSETHCNLAPIHFVVETTSAFIVFYEQTAKYSLRE